MKNTYVLRVTTYHSRFARYITILADAGVMNFTSSDEQQRDERQDL